ncbi:MAG TPA: class I SAM-dependent methyltransferase [Actinomycetota bacterium]
MTEPRPPSPKTDLVAIWGHAAEEYDQAWAHGLRTEKEREAWTGLLARLLPPDPPLRILDVGCGTGFLALLLAEAGHAVVGLDLSEAMLAVARREVARRGLTVELVLGDAEDPPGRSGTFDAVVSRHLLWTLPDPARAVRAWKDLVVPGGRVLAIDGLWQGVGVRDRLAMLTARLLERVMPRGDRGDGGPGPAGERLPLQDLTSVEPAREVFLQAGLTGVTAELLASLDAVERSVMPLRERLELRHRRYLVQGAAPAQGSP